MIIWPGRKILEILKSTARSILEDFAPIQKNPPAITCRTNCPECHLGIVGSDLKEVVGIYLDHLLSGCGGGAK